MARFHLTVLAALMAMALSAQFVNADSTTAKKVTGTSACATCSGVTDGGHQIMLITKDGERWVLVGNSDSYKKAHEVRDDGKTMTATLAGDPVKKQDAKGKDYFEVKVSDVKIDA